MTYGNSKLSYHTHTNISPGNFPHC